MPRPLVTFLVLSLVTTTAAAQIVPQMDRVLIPILIQSEQPGAYLFIERGRLSDVETTLRVQDASRQSLTWGTEIPVVRERDVLTRAFSFLDVPTDARFRQTQHVTTLTPSP